jgi:hypothetical protein
MHLQADLKGSVAEESEHLRWRGGARGDAGDAESPLMCAEQL